MRWQIGALLPTILVFLTMFSVLVLSSLTVTGLQWRMGNNFSSNSNELQYAELGLQAAETKLFTTLPLSCYSTTVLPFLSLGAVHACSFQADKYTIFYFIEKIENESSICIQANDPNILNSADLYRLTSWVKEGQNNALVLQTIYAKISQDPCIKGGLQVKVGRLSWRDLGYQS